MTTVKQNVYFPDEVLTDLQSAADQSGRSISWLINRAWQISRERVGELPAGIDSLETTIGNHNVKGFRDGETFYATHIDGKPILDVLKDVYGPKVTDDGPSI